MIMPIHPCCVVSRTGESRPSAPERVNTLADRKWLGPAFLVHQNFTEFSALEQFAGLLDDGRRSCDPHRRRFDTSPRQSAAGAAFADIKAMQGMLAHAGYDLGCVDTFSRPKERQAVKAIQLKYGLPADSYPTAELLARMRPGQ